MPQLPENIRALAALNARFGKMLTIASLVIEPSINKSADELVEKMKDMAPHRSGALADSIVATRAGDNTPENSLGESRTVDKHHVVISAGNAQVDYAVEVEVGSIRHGAAQPYFYPAINEMRGDAIKANLKKALVSALVKGAIKQALRS